MYFLASSEELTNNTGYTVTLNKSQSPWPNFKVTSKSGLANHNLDTTVASVPLCENLLRSRDTFGRVFSSYIHCLSCE